MCAWKSRIAGSVMPAALPDARSLGRRDVHRVARLDAEGRVPGIDVPDDAVDPILAIAVRVAGCQVADRLGCHLAGPGLGPAEEHALVAGKAVDDGGFRSVQGLMI